jgi:hypothetical protein
MKRTLSALILAASVGNTVALLAVDGDKAMYVGGTVAGMKEKSEGRLDTTSEGAALFTVKKTEPLSIPYSGITELEYGQKAGRRVGVAIMISPLALFSKKRNHFLTVSYKDAAGKDQALSSSSGKTSCGRR